MHGLITMRKVITGLIALAVVLATGVAVSAPAHADGSGDCNVRFDPTCTVGVGGGGGGGSGGSGGGGTNVDLCAQYPNAAYGDKPPTVSQACADELQGRYCNAMLGDMLGGLQWPAVSKLSVQQIGVVNNNLAQIGCPAIVTPATLAEQAFNSIVFPHPSGHRSPAEVQDYNGYPFTYVGLWTYYWTDPATWKPLTATASAAGLSATVTAVPVSLSFEPGNGSEGQSCAGPGRPWVESDGNSAPSEGACGYQYSKVTGPGYDHPITSTQTIVWKITWTGTGNTGGEIPGLSTSTSGQLNVLQIRTVNR
jgi:hypothetical protein